jgi:hypothetical protein
MDNNFTDKFLQFEEKNNLFELKILGVLFWPIIRFRVYMLLYQNINKTQINHPKKRTDQSLILILKSIYVILKKSPFFLKHKNTIIFNHPRKILSEKGFYECKYTEYLTNSDSYVFEAPFQDKHFGPTLTPNLYYLDLILTIGRCNSILSKFRYIKKEDRREISSLQQIIYKEFKVTIPNLRKLIIQLLFKHKSILFIANFVLKRIRPNQVIMAVAYSDINLPFAEQSKKMGIKVIEQQHGIMGKGHIAYNFLKKQDFNWFPDEIWVWNGFWAKNSRFPISEDCIKIKSFPFLDKFKKSQIVKGNDLKQIIIISQGPYSDILIDLALKLNNNINRKKYRIVFKPHPSELETNSKNIKLLLEQDISVLKDNNIYSIFNCSYCQIGVNSTALFEGIEFGLKTFIYKPYGWELFNKIDSVKFFDNELDIINNLC